MYSFILYKHFELVRYAKYYGDQIKQDEMGGTCRTNGRDE